MGAGFGDGPANDVSAAAATAATAASAGDCSLAAREGSIAPAFYWQLIDTERAAESCRAHTVILQAAPAAVVVAERVAAIRSPVLQKEAAKGICRWLPPVGRAKLFLRTNQCVFQDRNSGRFGDLSSRRF